MKYHDIVAHNLKHHLCPFCDMPQDFVLEQSDFFFVTLARAPYIEDHLLIIPNRHVILFNDLERGEIQDLMQFISKRTEKLHKKHPDVNFLLRDGFIGGSIGKSVNHMHFHLIPGMPLAPENKPWTDRQFIGENYYLRVLKKAKANFGIEK